MEWISFKALKSAESAGTKALEQAGEFIERNRLRGNDSAEYLKRVLEAARGEKKELEEIFKEIIHDAFRSAGLPVKEDVEELALRVDSLSSFSDSGK